MHIDFTEVLAAIKKHGDTTEITEDITRLVKYVQEMPFGLHQRWILQGQNARSLHRSRGKYKLTSRQFFEAFET